MPTKSSSASHSGKRPTNTHTSTTFLLVLPASFPSFECCPSPTLIFGLKSHVYHTVIVFPSFVFIFFSEPERALINQKSNLLSIVAASLTHSTKRAASHSDHPLEDGPTNVVVMRLLGAPNPQRRDCTRKLSSILVTLLSSLALLPWNLTNNRL
jgi:hypothetical protein